jgi:hypothetical protein
VKTVDDKRQFLRHTLATLAYRGGKALRDVPESFGSFRVAEKTRTPAQILAHICDLLDWSCCMVRGEKTWNAIPPGAWPDDVDRFFDALRRLDALLAEETPLGVDAEQLFQAPIADALTHVGQIAMLRRIAGSPIRFENYFMADIVTGRVGKEQSPPRREFE